MKDVVDRWNLNYSLTDRDESTDVRNVSFSWENQSVEESKANLNALLVAAGIRLKVVDAK